MALRTFFRVDKRNFDVGDKIHSANQFQALNPHGSAFVEEIFESRRPQHKPARNGAFYLFDDLVTAKKHWAKMIDSKLYEVEIDEANVAHRGDMRLVDEAFRSGVEAEMIQCADQYWLEKLTQNPRVELLTYQYAMVTKVISKDETERHCYFRGWAMGK